MKIEGIPGDTFIIDEKNLDKVSQEFVDWFHKPNGNTSTPSGETKNHQKKKEEKTPNSSKE